MLTAYLDDSGTSPSNNVIVVGGYFGTEHQWRMFDLRWKSLLSDYSVTCMRRADLENLKGEFEGWKPEKRTKFIIRAQSIIRKCTYVGFGHVVIKTEFDNLIPEGLTRAIRGAYGFCGYHCLKAIGEWCDGQNYQGKVRYVFEAGTGGHGQLDQMLSATYSQKIDSGKLRLCGWSFEDKQTTPLQAADVIAYELFKIGENHIARNTGRQLRASARALMRKRDLHYSYYWTGEHLKTWIELLAKEYQKRPSSFD